MIIHRLSSWTQVRELAWRSRRQARTGIDWRILPYPKIGTSTTNTFPKIHRLNGNSGAFLWKRMINTWIHGIHGYTMGIPWVYHFFFQTWMKVQCRELHENSPNYRWHKSHGDDCISGEPFPSFSLQPIRWNGRRMCRRLNPTVTRMMSLSTCRTEKSGNFCSTSKWWFNNPTYFWIIQLEFAWYSQILA